MTARHQLNAPRLDSYWMPFTANRQFKAAPRMLVAAEGMHYTSQDGRQVIDGTAGLWCVNAGHGRQRIADAVGKQLSTLDYAPSFQLAPSLAILAWVSAEVRAWRRRKAASGCLVFLFTT